MQHFMRNVLFACVPAIVPAIALAQADTTVRNAGAPRYPGVATLIRETSFGSIDGADEYVFGDISEIAVARDGSIYVFDRQVPALRKYDASGKYVRTFGRKGSGPGEYLNTGGLAVLRDGRVLLWDTGNWRINVYSPDGNVLPTLVTASGMGAGQTFGTGRALTVDSAGRIYTRRPIRDGRTRRNVYIRYRANGTVLDTIPAPQFGPEPPSISVSSRNGNARSSAPVPFTPTPKAVLSPLGYFITGFPSRYAFEIHSGLRLGSPVSIRRTVTPARVTAQERDSARKAIEELFRRTNPNWTWTGPDVPRTRPFYASIAVGDDGRIWIALVGEGRRPGTLMGATLGAPARPPQSREPTGTPTPALYDVYEPNGAYIGQVQVPPRVYTMVRRGDHIWAIELDDDDVQKVTRFRINWK
ncbi:MAG TPA: 6-bladed beta-propeller [Gemmatimonadaceae bacterium]|nr:6-bladed beta-propeller [Gemmatimonadaceae bacterium]